MKKIFDKYNNLPKKIRDSIIISATLVGLISTILSILGISLSDTGISNIWCRLGIVVGLYLLLVLIVYFFYWDTF